MSAVIYTNAASLVAQKSLLGAQNSLAQSVERLSSGIRINRAKDDAAGLGIAENLKKQLNAVKQGITNLNDAISLSQTAEGALQSVSAMTQRMVTLSTQGANDTLSNDQRSSIATELGALRTAINNIAARTSYSGNSVFNATAFDIQTSLLSADKVTISATALAKIDIASSSPASSKALALNTAIEAVAGATPTLTTASFQTLQTAASDYLSEITLQRGRIGATQNQLEYTVSNLTEYANNLSSAVSRVMDTDYASETANLTKGQILQQAATAMLAQANQMPNVILTLLK